MESSPPHLYTTREVADHLRISERTLRRLVATKSISHVVIGGRHRFTTAHINEYLTTLEKRAVVIDHGATNTTPRAPSKAKPHREPRGGAK